MDGSGKEVKHRAEICSREIFIVWINWRWNWCT